MIWAFENWSDFFMMGHYALYVWSAVGATCALLIGQLVYTINQNKKVVAQVKKDIKNKEEN
jgi:heme exporter protein D